MSKLNLPRFIGAAAILVSVCLLTSCELFGLSDDKGTETHDLGGVTYINSSSPSEILQLINSGQTGGNGERYGDIGTVVEWDVDFTYLLNPDPNDPYAPKGQDGKPLTMGSPEYQAYLLSRFNMASASGGVLPAWFKIELWGADGGNVGTKKAGTDPDPSTYTEEWIAENWEKDHYTDLTPAGQDYAFGGKGGYIAAYVKVESGQVLYFFVGGKGKDGKIITGAVGEENIYGFNGGGKGSGGHTSGFSNGAGGGGATSMAYAMAYFTQAVTQGPQTLIDDDGSATHTEVEIPAGTKIWTDSDGGFHYDSSLTHAAAKEKGWTALWKYDFSKGVDPANYNNGTGVTGKHFDSRILVAGGGGGASTTMDANYLALHGGNGGNQDEAIMGMFRVSNGGNAGNSNAPIKYPEGYKGWLATGNSPTAVRSGIKIFNTNTVSFNGKDGYRYTADIASGTAGVSNTTFGYVQPPFGFGKGLDGGDSSSVKGWAEGPGGGGGGFTGGATVFRYTESANASHPGLIAARGYPTGSGNGGTNGYFGMQVQTAEPKILGQAPADAVTVSLKKYPSVRPFDAVNAADGIKRDTDTGLITSNATVTSSVTVKLIKGGETGADGLSGVKTKAHLQKFPNMNFKGNGFISMEIAAFAEGESY